MVRVNTLNERALFINMLGKETFAKLKVLASPMPVYNLTLDAIMEELLRHYHPESILQNSSNFSNAPREKEYH